MTEIHDNLPAITLPLFTPFDWGILGLLLLGILIIVWSIWMRNPNISSPPVAKVFVPQVFSYIEERGKLENLLAKEQWKPFALEATKLFKTLLENRFKKPFAFATGQELSEVLQEDISSAQKQDLNTFFTLSDPIKFAQATGKKAVAEKLLQTLEEWK